MSVSWRSVRRTVLVLEAVGFLLLAYNRGLAQMPGGLMPGVFSGNGLPGTGPMIPVLPGNIGGTPWGNSGGWGNNGGNPWGNGGGGNPWGNGGNNLANFFPGQGNQQQLPGMSPTGRFFSYDLVTGTGVLSGPLPIARQFAGIGGMRNGMGNGMGMGMGMQGGLYGNMGNGGAGGGFPGTGGGQNSNYSLLPPGVQLNVAYNTLPGLPMTQAPGMNGMNGMSPYGRNRMNPYMNPYMGNPLLMNPYMKQFGNGGYGL